MTAPFEIEGFASLFLALIFGVFFGLSLERAGLGNPHKLTGVFYLRDFTVPKVMFTAILVACGGLYLLSDLGFVDLERVYFLPTFFWPQLAGGALFGIGFVMSGYCPGTAVAGFASGRLDALVMMAGVVLGSFLFAASYPVVERFYLSSEKGVVTLPEGIGLNHWIVIILLTVIAGGMFGLLEYIEKKGKPSRVAP